MKKKSRFLQTPIEPFVVESGLSAEQVIARMERISFQGRNLATAHHIWHKMLQDDVTIFLGMAGALSAGGLRLVVSHLILHRYIDCLVSTGANLYHDLHETRGQRHFVGSPHADDAALADERIDRVYDTYASEEEFCSNDEWIADFACTLETRQYTSREFVYLLGGGTPKNFINQASVQAEFYSDKVGGHRYALQIVTDVPHFGGASGSSLEEAQSWGKVATDSAKVSVQCDATIALPLLASALATTSSPLLAARRRPEFTLAGRTMTVDGQPVPSERFEEVNAPAV